MAISPGCTSIEATSREKSHGSWLSVSTRNCTVTRRLVSATTGAAAALALKPDRAAIAGDGQDLSFVTLSVVDAKGDMVRPAKNPVRFTIEGPGDIVTTDNGDPTDMTAFPSHQRNAFNGLALVIVRGLAGQSGKVIVRAEADGLAPASAVITVEKP